MALLTQNKFHFFYLYLACGVEQNPILSLFGACCVGAAVNIVGAEVNQFVKRRKDDHVSRAQSSFLRVVCIKLVCIKLVCIKQLHG